MTPPSRADSPLLGFTDDYCCADPLSHPSPSFVRHLPLDFDHNQTRYNTDIELAISSLFSIRDKPLPLPPSLSRRPRTPSRRSSRYPSFTNALHSANSSRHAIYIPDSSSPSTPSLSPASLVTSFPSPDIDPAPLDPFVFPAQLDPITRPLSPNFSTAVFRSLAESESLNQVLDPLFTLKSISAPASTAASRSVSLRSHSAHSSPHPSLTTPTTSTASLLTLSTPDSSPYSRPGLSHNDDAHYPCVSRWSLSTSSHEQISPSSPSHNVPLLENDRSPTFDTREDERGRVKDRSEKRKSKPGKRQRLVSFISRLSGAPVNSGGSHSGIEAALFSGAGAGFGPQVSSAIDQLEDDRFTEYSPSITPPSASEPSSTRSLSSGPSTPLWLDRSLKGDVRSVCSFNGIGVRAQDPGATMNGASATGLTGIGSRSSSTLSLLSLAGSIGMVKTRRTLVVRGLGKDDQTGYEAVKAWCEGFGELRHFSRKSNGNLHVDFRKSSVAETVCRIQAQVYIRGAGSVSLSWFTKKGI